VDLPSIHPPQVLGHDPLRGVLFFAVKLNSLMFFALLSPPAAISHAKFFPADMPLLLVEWITVLVDSVTFLSSPLRLTSVPTLPTMIDGVGFFCSARE